MDLPPQVLLRKLKEHSRLSASDVAEINAFSYQLRHLEPGEDFIRQGDVPKVAVLVMSGMVARYHMLDNGQRQYLSFHMTGDLPDAQALFIEEMDHAVCAIGGGATIASIPHKEICKAFDRKPHVGFAIWRETLIDAAIFREAITNNSARSMETRMAHLFCELFYRARASGLTKDSTFHLPISLTQLGETLGMSIATVNRTLGALRASRTMDFRNSKLTVQNWRKLAQLGEFNPRYLHLKKISL
jgi:CRP-like cAMP-binding protein